MILTIAGIGAAVAFVAAKLLSPVSGFISKLRPFFEKHEGFTAYPIWDYKQWSWGYGSFAGSDPTKKPAGSISRDSAWTEVEKFVRKNYDTVKKHITVSLNSNQWAALMSFAYNLGPGIAIKIAPYINAKKWDTLKVKWSQYVYAGGKKLTGLVNRRADELKLFFS